MAKSADTATAQPASISTSTEDLGGNQVKLRVEAPEEALKPAIDSVYRRLAGQIKVAGFRKGKVPRQLIDARVGPESVRADALEDALPALYRQGLSQQDIEPIAPPEIDIISFEPGEPLVFEATIDVRPEVRLPDLSKVTYEAEPSDVTEEELKEQLDRLRDRFAELETVGRPARRGDFVLIDLNGTHNGQPVEGVSQPDSLYEIGGGTGPPKLDEEVDGSRPGDILRFTDTATTGELAGQQISFTVLVKEVKAKKLPPLDDDLAKTIGEFDTLDELKDDLRKRMGEMKRGIVTDQIRQGVLQAFVEASDLEPPEKLVEAEFEHGLSHFTQDLEQAGLTMADYEQQTDTTELEIRQEIRKQAALSVKAELLLEQVAREQEIEVDERDMGAEIAMLAARSGTDPEKLAQQVSSDPSAIRTLASEVIKRKALDFVVAGANVTGRPMEETAEEEPADPAPVPGSPADVG